MLFFEVGGIISLTLVLCVAVLFGGMLLKDGAHDLKSDLPLFKKGAKRYICAGAIVLITALWANLYLLLIL